MCGGILGSIEIKKGKWVTKSSCVLHADRDDSKQTGNMSRQNLSHPSMSLYVFGTHWIIWWSIMMLSLSMAMKYNSIQFLFNQR